MTGDVFRVLVTGWRDWPESDAWYVGEILRRCVISHPGYGLYVVVHGKCPKGGVDLYADEWARAQEILPVEPEPHPAKWNQFGRAAGPIRNQEMVDLGANICLGFPGIETPGKKSGTRDCMEKAAKAGIEVLEFRWDPVAIVGLALARERLS